MSEFWSFGAIFFILHFPRNLQLKMRGEMRCKDQPPRYHIPIFYGYVSCGTNSNWDFGWIWICTEKLESFDLLDSGVWNFQWNLSCKDHSLQIRGRSFSAKEPLMIGLFCVKWPMTTRHPMHLRHPVQSIAFGVSINLNLQSQSHWSPFSHFFNLKSQSMI